MVAEMSPKIKDLTKILMAPNISITMWLSLGIRRIHDKVTVSIMERTKILSNPMISLMILSMKLTKNYFCC